MKDTITHSQYSDSSSVVVAAAAGEQDSLNVVLE